jgi:hypothetical protein
MIKASILFCAAMLACALTAGAVTQGPLTKAVTGTITGIGTPDTVDVDPTNGQCNFDTWVDQCPSGNDNCSCIQVSSPKATGSLGAGGTVISDFFISIDNGSNPASEPPPNGIGPSPSCALYFAVMTLTSTSGQSTTINSMGTSCKVVTGFSARNQNGTHDKDTLSGAWGISSDPAPSPTDASGWGTSTGTVIQSTQALTLHLSGDVTK